MAFSQWWRGPHQTRGSPICPRCQPGTRQRVNIKISFKLTYIQLPPPDGQDQPLPEDVDGVGDAHPPGRRVLRVEAAAVPHLSPTVRGVVAVL